MRRICQSQLHPPLGRNRGRRMRHYMKRGVRRYSLRTDRRHKERLFRFCLMDGKKCMSWYEVDVSTWVALLAWHDMTCTHLCGFTATPQGLSLVSLNLHTAPDVHSDSREPERSSFCVPEHMGHGKYRMLQRSRRQREKIDLVLIERAMSLQEQRCLPDTASPHQYSAF
jgi:hypothetical protein